MRRNAARSQIFGGPDAGEHSEAYYKENRPDMKEENDRRGQQRPNNGRQRAHSAEEIHDIDVLPVNSFVEIGIAQNLDEAGSDAG